MGLVIEWDKIERKLQSCREEKFLADEKHLLQPLPDQPFEIKYYRELKVAKNNHVYLTQDKHYYSVFGLKEKLE